MGTKIKKPVVVGIGEILWDMLPSGRQLGGAPANFAWFARALGAESYVVSSIGRDPAGRDILSKLEAMEFSRRYISVDRAHPTGVVEVKLDRSGKPAYDIRRNVAWDFIRFTPALRSLAREVEAVCFGSLAQRSSVSRQTIRKFVSLMPDSTLKICDINLRQSFYDRKLICDLLNLANVLKLNDDELITITKLFSIRGGEADRIRSLMRRFRLKVVAVTRGAKGAVLYCLDGVYPAAGVKVTIVDTVGAGDSFTAALVMGLINGVEKATIIKSANRLAGYVCGRPGATPMLSRDMIGRMKPICRHDAVGKIIR